MATDVATRPYIKYTPEIEKKPPGEDEDIQAVADMVNAIQKAQYNMHRHCYTGALSLIRVDSGAEKISRDARSNTRPRQGQIHRI